jgi:hypothetical protein
VSRGLRTLAHFKAKKTYPLINTTCDIDTIKLYGENLLRIVVEGALGFNTIEVFGAIMDDHNHISPYYPLGAIVGSTSTTVEVYAYDLIIIRCTVYGGNPFSVKLSGFMLDTF